MNDTSSSHGSKPTQLTPTFSVNQVLLYFVIPPFIALAVIFGIWFIMYLNRQDRYAIRSRNYCAEAQRHASEVTVFGATEGRLGTEAAQPEQVEGSETRNKGRLFGSSEGAGRFFSENTKAEDAAAAAAMDETRRNGGQPIKVGDPEATETFRPKIEDKRLGNTTMIEAGPPRWT